MPVLLLLDLHQQQSQHHRLDGYNILLTFISLTYKIIFRNPFLIPHLDLQHEV
jgi:hypothetical protein